MDLRNSFRRKLLLLALLPLALAQVVTIYAVMRTVENDVDERAQESLRIGAAVVDEYLEGRSEQLKTSVQVLASDFGLKEAVATGDADTIRSVLHNHGYRVDADVGVLLSLDGKVVASTDPAIHQNRDLIESRILDEDRRVAIQSTEVIGGVVYQVFAVPLRAPTPIAWVVLGFRLDASIVDRIVALTGLDVALVATGREVKLIAGSAAVPDATRLPEQLLQADEQTGPVYVIDGVNTNYLGTATPFVADHVNNAQVDVVLLRSISDAMAPYEEARRGLIVFGVALLLAVAMAGVWLSGGVARPISILTDAARSLKAGDYDVYVRVPSTDEIGELASSFNAMTKAIAEREERISHQALHDPLTDLPNYVNLARQLQELIDSSDGRKQKIHALSIRLSRMGAISSTLGHSASDDLVAHAARLLRINVDPGEILGQVGSEEFVLILPNSDIDDARECAEKLQGILAAGVTLGRVNILLQSAVGIAAYPEHGGKAADILRKASIARNEAESRDEQVGVYQSGREDHHVRQLRLVNDLRCALSRAQVEAWFQPKIALPDGRPSGAEALVRWRHPEYGYLSPDEFVPAAEEAGTIVHLTRYVLRQAIQQCRQWQDQGYPIQVSVNITARDLCDDYLPYYVLQLLKDQGVPPDRLTLEVTENSVMQQLARSITILECLRDAGVRISMDDFGTGQSSLGQLRHIPLDEVKIDKSFVMPLPGDSQNEEIVRATLQLASSLGLDVVAEGVENEPAMRFLSGAGCQQAQGYFVSRALPPAEFMDWLRAYRPVAYPERRDQRRPFRKQA
jgi:diguanylate cyclase (GGDEF)-like protein